MSDTQVQVLLVEPDGRRAGDVRRALIEEFRPKLAVTHVLRPAEGLQRLKHDRYDAVLVDASTAVERDLKAFTTVATNEQDLPVIVLGSIKEEQTVMRVVRQGAEECISVETPDPGCLAQAVRRAVMRRQLLRELGTVGETAQADDARLRRIIEESADGIIIVDAHGLCRLANPAAVALLGRSESELIGGVFGFPLAGEGTTELEVIAKHTGTRIAEMRVVATEWEGEPAHLASLRDVTERKRMLEELIRTHREQLEIRDRFLSHVSHELRSPLSPILQFTTAVRDGLAGEVTEGQADCLGIVVRNVHQLSGMIEQLLEATRAGTGRLVVRPQITSLAQLVSDTAHGFLPEASTKDISLSIELAPELPNCLADPDRVRQVLRNLLDNAIKYSPQNGKITVKANRKQHEDGLVQISVADNGPGIPADKVALVFEQLYQGTWPSDSSRQGLGLGLFISKELVNRQGGRIWVDTVEGKGSVFSFTLPVYSLAHRLRPLIEADDCRWNSIALITIDLITESGALPRGHLNPVIQEARKVVERCLYPDRDLLLPLTEVRSEGVRFYVVACFERGETEVLSDRIRRQLDREQEGNELILEPMVSTRQLEIPDTGASDNMEFVAHEIAQQVEELIGIADRQRSAVHG